MNNAAYKKVLFWLIVVVLTIPLLNYHWPIAESGRLYGAVSGTPDTAWSWRGWWTGAVQRKKENHINDSIGFRQDFVRIHNQLDFSLFRKLHANGVVLGEDGYLYEEQYINALCGYGYGGSAAIRRQMQKLKLIQDSLEARGKVFLFLLAPSKARFWPEYIPKDLRCAEPATTALYPDVCRFTDSLGIRTLDINRWFMSLKGKVPYPLFTRGGIHWSIYGSVLAMDTLLRHLQHYTPLNVPSLDIKALNPTRAWNEYDQEIEIALNLIQANRVEEVSRPAYEFIPRDTNRQRPKIIFLGDSFIWSLIYRGLPEAISENWEFWYFFNEVWRDGVDGSTTIADMDWRASLDGADAVIMTYTETNLGSNANGFLDSACHYFVKEKKRLLKAKSSYGDGH